MKRNFTFLVVTITLICASVTSFSQSLGDYRSAGTGNWLSISSWERFDGSTWQPAVSTPTFSDGQISIRSAHTITLNGPVTADQLVIDATGALNINVFSSASGGNDLTLNDGAGTDLTVNGTLLLRAFNRLNGPGTATVNGTFNFYSGFIAAQVTTASGSVTNFDLDFTKVISASFTNNGTLNWLTAGAPVNVTLTGATFTNNGTINEQFGGNCGFFDGGGGAAIVNTSVINKTSTFQLANSNINLTNSGVLRGIGTYNINAFSFTNTGTVAPGNSPGILAVTPAVIEGQNASINVELVNGSGPGTGHDRLDVSGNVNLSTLTLTVIDPGGAAPLQAYTVMTTTGTFTGTFAVVNMNPLAYTINYNPTSVVITKTASTLPARWGEFKAQVKDNSVVLYWSTLQEENTADFSIEYSNNGSEFKELGKVPAKGNSFTTTGYTFTHATPEKNKNNIYRIRLNDIDGKKSFTSVLLVKLNGNKDTKVFASPNPFTSNLQIRVADENIQIRIFDIKGSQIRNLNLTSGVHSVNLNDLTPGLYKLVVYQNNKVVQTQSIIKQ